MYKKESETKYYLSDSDEEKEKEKPRGRDASPARDGDRERQRSRSSSPPKKARLEDMCAAHLPPVRCFLFCGARASLAVNCENSDPAGIGQELSPCMEPDSRQHTGDISRALTRARLHTRG